MTRKLNVREAEKRMLKNGLAPLEPYKNSSSKWKCECLKCKKIVFPTYGNVSRGQSGCAYCSNRIKDKVFLKNLLVDAGLKPLVPIKSTRDKLKCKCMACGEIVFPRIFSIQQGKGGCKYCAVKKRASTIKLPEKKAISLMKKAGVIPLVPYKNMNTPWKGSCKKCGKIVKPRLSDAKKGLGCKRCSNLIANQRLRISEKTAIKLMLRAQLKPLVSYRTSGARWKCQCLKCEKVVYPSYNSIQQGQGGCKSCADSGFNPNLPSYLYLITNSKLKSHKIGIANKNTSQDRLKKFVKQGWKVVNVWDFKHGVKAYRIEKRVLGIVRKDLRIQIHIKKTQMPKTEGYTETIDSNFISIKALNNIILNEMDK